MLSIISGLVLTGGGGVSLWYLRPQGGQPHPWARIALLDSLIPIGVVAAFAIGVALIVSGVVAK
jgi:hypothetical protein